MIVHEQERLEQLLDLTAREDRYLLAVRQRLIGDQTKLDADWFQSG